MLRLCDVRRLFLHPVRLTPLQHCVCVCVYKLESGVEREKEKERETAMEIKEKVKRKGQPLGSTTDVVLWMRNDVGKQQRGRGKSGAVDHGGILRTFSSQKLCPKFPLRLPSNVKWRYFLANEDIYLIW